MMAGRKGISSFSVLLLLIVAAVTGIAAVSALKIQYTPVKPEKSITVSFSYPGASAYVVEGEVTSKLEGVLSNVTSVTGVTSVSNDGVGSVTLRFGKKTDMAAARFEAASFIRNIYPDLPSAVTYPSLSLNTGGTSSRTAMLYNIKSSLSTKEIADFVDERIIPQLSTMEGVEWVRLSGVTPYEWVVEFDPDFARIHGITADDISRAFRLSFSEKTLGMIRHEGSTYSVRFASRSTDDFGAIPIKLSGERMICLRDIATVSYRESEPDYYFRLNGLNTVNLSLGISSEANLLAVATSVRERMDGFRAFYPAGLTSSLSFDSSEYIASELRKILFRTVLCLILLLAFVFAVYRSWRYMAVIALTITVNLLVAAAVYWLVGLRIHIYTLAGITVSLGIIIDSAIIMTDHYSRCRNRGAFPALFCATFTTVAVLMVILLLPDKDRANLTDFAYVIAINLCVSLLTAYLFVPALLDHIRIDLGSKAKPLTHLRRVARWNARYEGYIRRGIRHRWAYIVILVIVFGIPTVLLPNSVGNAREGYKWYQTAYNKVLSWGPYANNRNRIDKILGTSFAKFHETVGKSDFYREPSRNVLTIRAGMPEGCTAGQLNEVMKSMENYISQYSDKLDYFTTQIFSYDDGVISVYFKPEYEESNFPSLLKSEVTAMAINFGGANWSISGINQSYFNNNVISDYKSDRITLTGYSYNTLIDYANTLKDYLSQNPRVSGPEIRGSGYWDRPTMEYHVSYDYSALAAVNVNPYSYYSTLYTPLYDSDIGTLPINGDYSTVRLRSSARDDFDLWHILNSSVPVDSTSVKLSQIGGITAEKSGISITRENQSYSVTVVYDFIGSRELAGKAAAKAIDYMNDEVLPLGYRASGEDWYGWRAKSGYGSLICLVIVLIFAICSVFFESLRLPFAIILLVPVSFIGLFLTFGISGLTFDQGGFAAFVMLVGVSINAGIYLVYEYLQDRSRRSVTAKYVRAFDRKIVPILLTVVSTVLGLVPFLFDGPKEVFWFDFAAGTIAGLVFSVLALILYLPVFCLNTNE